MLSRKSKDKSKEGVVGVGKYVKKDTPPEIPGLFICICFITSFSLSIAIEMIVTSYECLDD